MLEKFKDIPGWENWQSVDLVEKGWSKDKKYHVLTKSGEDLLLRVSDIQYFEGKHVEFDVIKQIDQLGIEMSSPYEIGICNEGVYMILKWLKGHPLEDVMTTFSPDKQYRLGLEAGDILRRIHGLDTGREPIDWALRFNKKIKTKADSYNACPLRYDMDQPFRQVIMKYQSLLEDRPTCLHHGDYHIGNMIYCESGQVGIIDFNRFDYGDPWEEFNRIVWDIQVSPAFAAGRIDGYFKGHVPEEFFKLLGLYIANNTLSSLPWALEVGDEEVETMKKQARDNLAWFDNFESPIPSWYDKERSKYGSLINH